MSDHNFAIERIELRKFSKKWRWIFREKTRGPTSGSNPVVYQQKLSNDKKNMFSNQTSCWWEHLPERKIQPDQLLVVKEVAQMICFRLVVVWTSGCTSFQHKSVIEASESLRNHFGIRDAFRREKLVQVQRWTSKWVELLKKVVCLSLFCSVLYYQRPLDSVCTYTPATSTSSRSTMPFSKLSNCHV